MVSGCKIRLICLWVDWAYKLMGYMFISLKGKLRLSYKHISDNLIAR